MEQRRYEAPLNSPPYFDGSNYPHWKAEMEFFSTYAKKNGLKCSEIWMGTPIETRYD